MFDKILVPIDGSKGSERALQVAAEVAQRFGSKVVLVFVAEPPGMLYPPGLSYVDLMDSTTKWGREIVGSAAEKLQKGGISEVEKHVREGHPAQVILDSVAEWKVDLVVMGTHGRRGLDRVLLGSVAEEVVRRSPVPVITVRVGNNG